MPFSIIHISSQIPLLCLQYQIQLKINKIRIVGLLRNCALGKQFSVKYVIYLESIVSPASKLHITSLFIKWEPSNVNFAGGLEDARGDVGTHALVGHHNVSVVCSIKGFVCTKNKDLYKLLKLLFETRVFSSFDFCVCCVVLN